MKIEIDINIKGLEFLSKLFSAKVTKAEDETEQKIEEKAEEKVKDKVEEIKDIEHKENQVLGFTKINNPEMLSDEELQKRIIYMISFCKSSLGIYKSDIAESLQISPCTVTQLSQGVKRKRKLLLSFFNRVQNIILINTTIGN